MERFHDILEGKIGRFGSRNHRFNYAKKANYQFATANITKLFKCGNKTTKNIRFMKDNYKLNYLRIGALVKEKRKELELTQQQLADKINKFDRSKISDIENGKEDFQFSTLIKIFSALNLDVEINVKPTNTNIKKDA